MPSPNLIGLDPRQSHHRVPPSRSSATRSPSTTPRSGSPRRWRCSTASRGRLISGFPVGTSMDTAYAYSMNPASLREKYHEGVDLVLKAWTATEPFAFNGRFTQMRYVNVFPRPLQQPHPPIWIPGGGSVETWDYCSTHDYVYAALSYYGHLMAKETVGGYWRTVRGERQGRQPVPAGVPPVHRGGGHRPGGVPAVQGAGRILLQPLAPRVPGLCRPARLPHRGIRPGALPSQVRAVGPGQAGQARPDVGRDGGEGLRRHRQPRHRTGDPRGRRQDLQLRAPAHHAALRQHERRAHPAQLRSCSARRSRPACAACSPMPKTTGGRRAAA